MINFGKGGGTESSPNLPLHIQLFFHPLAVKAVFQVACGGVGSLGSPIGVDACRSLLSALAVAALLFGGVGNLNVSRADAASGGAALAVLIFAAGVNPALLDTAKVAADFATVLLLPVTDIDADSPDIFTPSGQVADTLDGLVALLCGIGCRHGTDSSVSALSCPLLCTAEWTCCARSVTGELNATVKPFCS